MRDEGNVDFRAALRRLDALGEVPVETRQRAFAVWVALFDVADDQLGIRIPSRELTERLGGLSRVTWGEYRAVLVKAGLLRVGEGGQGPRPQSLELLPPMRS